MPIFLKDEMYSYMSTFRYLMEIKTIRIIRLISSPEHEKLDTQAC